MLSKRFHCIKKKIVLEIGFGSGEHLVNIAEKNPNIQFIGCDYYLNGVASTVIKIVEKELKNIKIYYGDAANFLAKAPDKSIENIYLLYPDPWPKARHTKRRFVSSTNLRTMSLKLDDKGSIHIATDSEIYFSYLKSKINKRGSSGNLFFKNLEFSKPWPDWYETKYERKAKKAGRSSFYMILKKNKFI